MEDLYHYECYDPRKGYIHTPEPDQSLAYGDLISCPHREYPDKELFVMPKYLSGSDYCNSGVVEVSNHRAFLEEFKDVEGVHEVWGGFGTYAVAIRLDVYESNEEIKGVVNALDDYPVLDQDDLSRLEDERSQEAWDDWARADALRLLQKSHEYLEEFDDDFDDDFYRACDESGTYWAFESGNSIYIDFERVIPYVRDRLLARIAPLKDLPLLVSHDWVSKEAKGLFLSRLKGE